MSLALSELALEVAGPSYYYNFQLEYIQFEWPLEDLSSYKDLLDLQYKMPKLLPVYWTIIQMRINSVSVDHYKTLRYNFEMIYTHSAFEYSNFNGNFEGNAWSHKH